MARTSPTVTKKENDAYQKFCDEHNIVADESEAARINGDEIGNYIAVQGGEDITPATLAVALQKLRDRLTFYTPAQAEYKKVADKNPTAANELNSWFQHQTILEKEDSDVGLQNQTVLLV